MAQSDRQFQTAECPVQQGWMGFSAPTRLEGCYATAIVLGVMGVLGARQSNRCSGVQSSREAIKAGEYCCFTRSTIWALAPFAFGRMAHDRQSFATPIRQRLLTFRMRSELMATRQIVDQARSTHGSDVPFLDNVFRAANPQNAVIDDMTVFEGQLSTANDPGKPSRVRTPEFH